MYNFFKGAQNSDLYEFSTDVAINPFGVELMANLSEIYENIDEGIEGLVEGSAERGIEVTEDQVRGLLSGEYIPTEQFVIAMKDLFWEEGEDEELVFLEDDYEKLVSSAEAATQLAEIAEELLDSEEEDEEDYEDEDEGTLGVDPELLELREKVAEQELRNQLTENLSQVTEYASSLVKEGKLPPAAFRYMLGEETRSTTSRLAEFSSYCEEKQIDSSDHLDQVLYALDVFEQCGLNLDFSVYADDEIKNSQESRKAQNNQEVKAMYKAYKESL